MSIKRQYEGISFFERICQHGAVITHTQSIKLAHFASPHGVRGLRKYSEDRALGVPAKGKSVRHTPNGLCLVFLHFGLLS